MSGIDRRLGFTVVLTVVLSVAGSAAQAQRVTKEDVPGITNFAHIETIVACAGATKPEAVPAIKQMGFVSIINLREADEPGANVTTEEQAAKAAGLRYYRIPFNADSPSPEAADKFLDAISAPGTEPAFIHCSGGSRAAMMWLIKRIVIDHWDEDTALNEASDLGLDNPKLMQWALHYADSHQREARIPRSPAGTP